MRTKLIQSSVSVLSLVLIGGTAGVVSGAVVYQDNFDNVAVGSVPSPQVGTYVGGQAVAGNGISVPPSAPNYLDSAREDNEDFYGDLAGSPLVPGTAVHAEFAVNIVDGYPVFGLTDGLDFSVPHTPDGSGILMVSGTPDGSIVYAVDPSGALQSTGLTHKVNEWETWAIDYVVGAPSFDLTVGANSTTLGAGFMLNSAATQLEGITTYTFSGATHVLIDDVSVTAIPEPTSLSLLCLAGMALLRKPRHRKL